MKRSKLIFLGLFLSLIFSLFSFASNKPTVANAEDTQYTYRYTESSTDSELGSMVTTYQNYYMDDIEGGFGTLTKTFSYPSSFSVSASLKQEIVLEAIQQIIAISEITSDAMFSYMAINVEGVEREYETYDLTDYAYPDIDLNANLGSRIIESEGEYDITGYYCFSISSLESMVKFRSVRIYFNLDPLHMTPIVDGSLIYLYNSQVIQGNNGTSTSANIVALEGVFSTDPASSGYVVSAVSDHGLPSNTDEYRVTYYYGDTAAITGTEYDSTNNPVKDEDYNISASLEFMTVDGVWHTLRTNTITIKSHRLTMRINGIEDYRVAVDKEYEYSFIFDDDDYNELDINSYYYLTFEEDIVTIDDYGKTTYTFTSVGKKTIEFDHIFVYFDGHSVAIFYKVIFEVEVLSEEPEVIPPDYNIDFSFESGSAAIFGGEEFEVSAKINEFYGDEHFVTEISVSGNSLGVLQSNENSLTLIPLNVGRSVIHFKATSKTAGEFSENIFLDVIQSTSENTSIEFVDEFNLTGSNVVAYLKIGEYSSFINLDPTWSIKVEDGENLIDVNFIKDELGRAIIEEAPRGYYHYSVSGNGIVETQSLRRVADVNMAEVAASTLPFLAPIMILIVIIVIVLRYKFRKRHTLHLRLTKVSELLDSFLKELNDKSYKRYLRRIISSIKKCQATAYLRDQETLGQYQVICNILSKSLKMCYAMNANIEQKDLRKFLTTLKNQFIDEAIRICSELDEALEKYASQKVVAAVTVPNVAKRDKKQDYEEMAKKFYRHGDEEDDNGRTGDSDRNADTKTEG